MQDGRASSAWGAEPCGRSADSRRDGVRWTVRESDVAARLIAAGAGERYGACGSSGCVARDAGPPGRSSPGPAPPPSARSPRVGAAAHTARGGSSGSSSPPSGSRPSVSSTSGGSPRNVPIGTLLSLQATTAAVVARNWYRPPPGSADRRVGPDTGHPQAAPCATSMRWSAVEPTGTTTGVAGRRSPKGERSCTSSCVNGRTGQGGTRGRASGDDRRELATHKFDRPHGSQNANDRPDEQRDKGSKAARESVRRSSGGRRSGYVVPTRGRG
jgi:hypothetical protein